MKKYNILIHGLTVVLCLTAGFIFGNQFTRPHSTDAALRQAHEYLDTQCTSAILSQCDLNLYSCFMMQIANMRCHLLDNQQPDTDEWLARYDAEMAKPSEFEGGSAAPLDIHLRAYQMQIERINELIRRNKKCL